MSAVEEYHEECAVLRRHDLLPGWVTIQMADAAIAELEAEVERLQADTKRLMRILDDSGIGTPVEIVDRWNKARRRP